MKADAVVKTCLLACAVLAAGPALAEPIISTPSPYTVNSIHFSYMNYSQPPASYFHRRPPPFRGLPPPLPAAEPPAGAPGPQLPPAPTGQTGTPPLIEPPVQSPVVVAVPEPGTFALLGLGLALLLLRGRQFRPAA
ncbi:PEP-CTERM sorting domain-containing protein [Pseudoduganella sp. HUAS MS19]